MTGPTGWRGQVRRALGRVGLMAGLLVGFGFGPCVFAADSLPYTLVIAPTGDAAIDRAITDASQLAGLRERAPVGPFALLARAESDAARFDTVLRSFGYYDGRIKIRIAGLAIDDPTLFPVLEDRSAGLPVKVAVAIASGPLYRLGIVRLDGPVPAQVRPAFTLQSGEPARAAAVLAAGEAVLQALREDGFALAQVPPPDALVDHDTRLMDVVYLAEPGPRVALGAMTINGLIRLREDYVRRRLNLAPGEPFSPARLEAARRDLLADGVLAWARLTPGTTPDAEGRLPLTLDVAERPLRVVRLAGAFSSDEGATGSAAWTHRNLFGGAEQLTLRADLGQVTEARPQAASYLVNGSLRIPDRWLRDLALRLDLGAVNESLEAYDREAVTAGAVLERRFSEQLAGSAGLAFERSRVTQDDIPRDYRLLSLPLTLTYDTTDDPLNPRRGLRLAAQVAPTQQLGQASDKDGSGFVRGRVAGSAYLDLGELPAWTRPGKSSSRIGTGQSVLAGRLVLGSILGAAADQVPPDWRFYAGGGGSVRGYPFQSIGPRTLSGTPAGGDGLFEASLEWRRRFGANWGLAMFLDAGAVSATDNPDAGALAVGLGIGVRYHTPIGPVRADIATPLDPQEGDAAVQLYIGIGQAF
ncbi:autotransporter assembly complex family protein [uncultured Lamprocystis sp.]|jgi:translocation and assembly module TamA|uniref:autotransporter assembly complex protein TamA n=1 Tax=uncultured Lamprocystis sp. TaxID=543132 RepID=UPI0025D5792E|nr:BamA/TamA family outer membrane protein [uncultured Lamprocystis sp.]